MIVYLIVATVVGITLIVLALLAWAIWKSVSEGIWLAIPMFLLMAIYIIFATIPVVVLAPYPR